MANIFEGKLFKIVDLSTLLPLNMLKFTVTTLDNFVELIWEIVNERNINSFEIQRSVDGKSFQSLGKVQSNTIFWKESNFYKYYDN